MRPAEEGNGSVSEADAQLRSALAQAGVMLAEHRAEIDRLQAQLESRAPFDRLRDAFSAAAAAETMGSPVTHSQLLTMIVQTAADVMRAESALLLLLDPEGDDLISEIARGVDQEDVEELRIPLGHGIAGLVAASGQPMAISNAATDTRVAPEIIECLEYFPDSLLCVPLIYGERVIGVLEVLEKDPGRSFSARDIELLTQFARQAAVAIAQSRARRSAIGLATELLGGDSTAAARDVEAFAAELDGDRLYGEVIELAELVRRIANAGEDEAAMCRAILVAFAGYVDSRPTTRMDTVA